MTHMDGGGGMNLLWGRFLTGSQLYSHVVQERLLQARTQVCIATANVKAMMVEGPRGFEPVVHALARLGQRGVDVRLLHADKPSRPFVAALAALPPTQRVRVQMRVCPRVHFKTVLVDHSWAYLGSANLTGAGLGAKDAGRRNFETGMATTDANVVDHLDAMFQAIWSGAECASCKLTAHCPKPLGPIPALSRRGRAAPKGGIQLGRARRLPVLSR